MLTTQAVQIGDKIHFSIKGVLIDCEEKQPAETTDSTQISAALELVERFMRESQDRNILSFQEWLTWIAKAEDTE